MAILQTRTIYTATRIYEDTVIHTYTYIDNDMHIHENKRARKKNKKKKCICLAQASLRASVYPNFPCVSSPILFLSFSFENAINYRAGKRGFSECLFKLSK